MHLTAPTSTLIAALARVAPAAGDGKAMPILASVLITAADRAVSLRAGDLDVDVRAQITGDTVAPGACCVSPRDLMAALKATKAESVDLRLSDGRLVVTGGRARAELSVLDADQYPATAPTAGTVTEIDARSLARALGAVSHAVSEDEGRVHLCGVHVGAEMLSASDGHRLARHPLPGLTGDAIVPRDAVVQLLRALPASGPVQVTLSRERICVTADGYSVAARLIDGAFPNVDKVVPAASQTWVAVDRLGMLGAVRGVMTLASAKARALELARAGEDLTLSASDADRGALATSIEVGGDWTGKVKVNGDYLIDTLTACTGDQVMIEIRDSLAPIVVREGGAVYVVMPLR